MCVLPPPPKAGLDLGSVSAAAEVATRVSHLFNTVT